MITPSTFTFYPSARTTVPTISVRSQLNYEVKQPSTFVFKIAAATTQHQSVDSEQFIYDPEVQFSSNQTDLEQNRIYRAQVNPCNLTLTYEASVQTSTRIGDNIDAPESQPHELPPEVLPYLNPSRYCESDLLGRFAIEEFGAVNRGYGRVLTICDWVNDHLDYVPGATGPTTTAADVILSRNGVCRDYAHLAISLCRGLGIPARYVSGYACNLQPPDFHGFFEAYLGGQWYFFDPTRLASVDGLVRIATGRDAADTAFATITGNTLLVSKQVEANMIAS